MATLIFCIDPFLIAGSYLVPLNILLTASIMWFAFEIVIPPIMVTQLGFPFDPNWDFIGVSFTKVFGLTGWNIFYTGVWSSGFYFGLLIFVIATEAKYIARTLKAVVSGNIEMEKGEVFPYRILCLGVTVCGAIFVALLAVQA